MTHKFFFLFFLFEIFGSGRFDTNSCIICPYQQRCKHSDYDNGYTFQKVHQIDLPCRKDSDYIRVSTVRPNLPVSDRLFPKTATIADLVADDKRDLKCGESSFYYLQNTRIFDDPISDSTKLQNLMSLFSNKEITLVARVYEHKAFAILKFSIIFAIFITIIFFTIFKII